MSMLLVATSQSVQVALRSQKSMEADLPLGPPKEANPANTLSLAH
jgi:hypothetical protein